jgi:hypothetical protein
MVPSGSSSELSGATVSQGKRLSVTTPKRSYATIAARCSFGVGFIGLILLRHKLLREWMRRQQRHLGRA